MMKRVALVLLAGLLTGIVQAQTLRMTAVQRLPFQQTMRGVAAGNGVSVAVGDAGSIYSTADGMAWTRREANVRSDLHAVAWTGSAFCAVGNDGCVLTSPDGAVWTPRNSGTRVNLATAAAGGGGIVAAGDTGKILTSTDGIAWAAVSAPAVERINSLAHGAGGFVAVTEGGEILTSPDAATWTAQASSASGALSSVAFASGVFVAAGAGGEILTSPDGMAWTVRRSGKSERLWCVAAVGGGFLAVGSGGAVVQSADGLSWSAQSLAGSPLLRAVAQGGFGIFSVSESGGLWTSGDGSAWTLASSGGDAGLSAVAAGGPADPFVAVGAGGAILSSPDGFQWTVEDSPALADLESIAFGESKYVAVGAGGSIFTSASGSHWTAAASGTTNSLHGVTYGPAGFVAVGHAGLVLHSANGTAWTSTSVPGAKGDLLSVASGNGLYVAVGQWGKIATSPDGIAWTLLPDEPTQKERWYDITGIAYANGRFVTSTHFGTSFTSTDGTTWTKRTAAMVPGFDFYGAVALGDSMAVFGDAGTIQVSSNGTSWSEVPRVSGARLRGAATRGNISVFVGDNGAILQGATLFRQINWTAYHAAFSAAGDAVNTTTGASKDVVTALKNQTDGSDAGSASIKYSWTGTYNVRTDNKTGWAVGTDAHAIFQGFVGLGTQGDNVSSSGGSTITISGLDPAKLYELAVYSGRDSSSFAATNLNVYALQNASVYSTAHSTGVTGSTATASVAVGMGCRAAGRVVQWTFQPLSSSVSLQTSAGGGAANSVIPQAIRISEMTEAPVIVAGPASAEAPAGNPLTLTSSVLGTGVTYQWYQRDPDGNVSAVPAATSPTLNLSNVSESAQYFVRASASGGSVDSSASTVIVQRTYEQWAAIKGLPPSADADDSDGDGLPNLVEYALGTNPSAQTPGPAFAIDGSNRLSLTFRASKETGGVTMIPEASATLTEGSWTSPELEQLPDENFATESWVASVPLTSARTFLRLRITRP